MILKASHNRFLYGFFRLYTRLRINGAFRKVTIRGDVADRGIPVLVLANHFSWWDGFWVMYMNIKLFRRKFYYMMLEEQLRRHMFFNKMGGYSVKRGSRSIIESIKYTVDLLKDNSNMVLLFPQGRILSIYQGSISFEKGIEKVISEAGGRSQVLFEINLVEYFSHARPSLYIYLCEYTGPGKIEEIEKAYNEFYAATVKKHSDMKGIE
jgi:1-acyl-sn-glycerol-3-phosphate acyltransferase